MEQKTQNRQQTNLIKKFQKDIYESDIIQTIMKNATHANIYHDSTIYAPKVKQIHRMLTEKKKAESIFYNVENSIENTLYEKTTTIIDWLHNNDAPILKITAKTGFGEEDGIGIRCIDNKLQECIAYETTMILKRANNEYGFTCITAYPNILRKTAQPTYRNIRPELHETNAYKNAPEEQKQIWNQMVLNGLKRPEKSDTKTKITNLDKRTMPHNIDELLAAETKPDDYYFEK